MKRRIIQIIKKLIPNVWKKQIKRKLNYKYNKPIISVLKNTVGKNRIILLLTPTHGNIGDHAITICEHMFLDDNFNSYIIIDIPEICWEYEKNRIVPYIQTNDYLLIHGGGFIGTLWDFFDYDFREIIQTFPNNKIIVFPQSIFFSNDSDGKEQLDISRQIYTRNPQLVICARERFSYECVERNHLLRDTNKCFLMPDMVTYYKQDFSHFSRTEHVLLCLRNDKEKVTDTGKVNEIIHILSGEGFTFSYTDTVVPYRIFEDKRNEEVTKKLQEFAQCKFVITDRLHGMLLAAVTGTPCLFMDNCSKKVSGTYEWIKNLEYIKPLKDMDCLRHFIKQLETGQTYHYSNEHLQSYYTKLAEIIRD